MKIWLVYIITTMFFWNGILSSPSSTEASGIAKSEDPARDFMHLLQDFMDFTKDMVAFYIDPEGSDRSNSIEIQESRETTRREINDIVEMGRLIDVKSLEGQWKSLLSEHQKIADAWLDGFRGHYEKVKSFYQDDGRSNGLDDILLTRVLYIILVYDIIKEATRSNDVDDKTAYTNMIRGEWKEGGWEGLQVGILRTSEKFLFILADSTVFRNLDECGDSGKVVMNVLALFETMEKARSHETEPFPKSYFRYIRNRPRCIIRYHLDVDHGMSVYNIIGKRAAIIMLEDPKKYKEDASRILKDTIEAVKGIDEEHEAIHGKLNEFKEGARSKIYAVETPQSLSIPISLQRTLKNVFYDVCKDFRNIHSSMTALNDLLIDFGNNKMYVPLKQRLEFQIAHISTHRESMGFPVHRSEICGHIDNMIYQLVSIWHR